MARGGSSKDWWCNSCPRLFQRQLYAYLLAGGLHCLHVYPRKTKSWHATQGLRAVESFDWPIGSSWAYRPTLDFLISDVHGVGHWETQTLSTAYACNPWSKAFFQHYLQMTWLNDLANQEVPWITSYPSEGQMHLADWIAFSLDFPSWIVGKKANREINWAKQVIERSALSVLTQLALRTEEFIQSITTNLEFQRRGKKGPWRCWRFPSPSNGDMLPALWKWSLLNMILGWFMVVYFCLTSKTVSFCHHPSSSHSWQVSPPFFPTSWGTISEEGSEQSWWQPYLCAICRSSHYRILPAIPKCHI